MVTLVPIKLQRLLLSYLEDGRLPFKSVMPSVLNELLRLDVN